MDKKEFSLEAVKLALSGPVVALMIFGLVFSSFGTNKIKDIFSAMQEGGISELSYGDLTISLSTEEMKEIDEEANKLVAQQVDIDKLSGSELIEAIETKKDEIIVQKTFEKVIEKNPTAAPDRVLASIVTNSDSGRDISYEEYVKTQEELKKQGVKIDKILTEKEFERLKMR